MKNVCKRCRKEPASSKSAQYCAACRREVSHDNGRAGGKKSAAASKGIHIGGRDD